MSSSVTQCVILAAGYGTRFLPATKSQPKEMLAVVDKPVIQYLVEEAVSAGITDIIIVTSRGKSAIQDHFDASFELEEVLHQKWKIKELEWVQRISKLAHISYVRQPLPRGDGDALLYAIPFLKNDPCLILFGDDLIVGEKSGATQLVEAYNQKQWPIIALEKVSDERVSSYGIVESTHGDGLLYPVSRFLEKPKPTETTSRLWVIGKYIITPKVFEFLQKNEWSASKDGEIRLADAFASMVDTGELIYGMEIEGKRYDTGDKLGFLKANIDFALAREDLSEQLLAFLKTKI